MSTAQQTQPRSSSQTMLKEIMRVMQAMMEHYIPPDIRLAAGSFQLPTFSQKCLVPPASSAPQSAPPALQTDPSSRSHISDDDGGGEDN
ncbi:hypothetical protein Dimus_029543 [Dionaea muscipula]